MKLIDHIPTIGRSASPDVARDRAEVLEYITTHPGCKRFDIELECHMSRAEADWHLRKLKEMGEIGNGWWAL